MPYKYEDVKPEIFKPENQKTFLKVRDDVNRLIDLAGAVRLDKVMPGGDTWTSMAYVDRLVELGEIKEVPQPKVWGQNRIFIR
jgi:hypothetical protein